MSDKRLDEIKKKMREKVKKQYEEDSLKRLSKIVATKIKTTFIGSISAMEEKFGFLWGHGKPEHELTPQERELFILWNSCRTEILNNGNNQLRSIQSELESHTVFWNRYHVEFSIKPRSEEDFND